MVNVQLPKRFTLYVVLLAVLIGATVVITVCVIQANFEGKLTTISDAAGGKAPNRTIVSVGMAMYAFVRGIQLVAEYAEIVDSAKAKPVRALVVTLLDAAAQFSLILLLSITSTEFHKTHMVFVGIFLVLYSFYAIASANVHYHPFFAYTTAWYAYWARVVLAVAFIGIAIGVGAAFSIQGNDRTVAILELTLTAVFLVHGALGGVYLDGLRVVIVGESIETGEGGGVKPSTTPGAQELTLILSARGLFSNRRY
jgi:hypothetical protein